MRAVAILTAAGSGERLGGGGPKALVELGGVPLVVRAAHALLGSGVVDHLVVTAPGDAVVQVADALARAEPPVAADVVVGGASRQASVAAGLAVVAALPGAGPGLVVLVHDAARPQVPADVVRRVVAAVRAGHGAVVPGLPVTDTVKQVDAPRDGAARVLGTPDRRALRAVQTPQGFTLDVLARAHGAGAARAGDEATAATDDAALVEALGLDVWVVDGHEDAMKITTARDLAVAHALLAPEPPDGGR
ncbi:2-C-methyl-D-erythritol 4-phosphate cytidylyltransferase [Actinotalea sp.]|uniref:2-C-methyl-D-erythritol 4-phosphate cytidylyltransferase n=1 Tax=Actinotalea sp. TaxID=1872145 RepID=UPI002C2DBA31|nr:2-C-methyl-D-erythritol 4-phosphate cytidylyltransferase [Actinotalea sp.]HRA50785.1 2-C-methyl-D-erythritol 4-phosphate cytidylyltransferase [Actinotalea sp.]